MRVVNWKWNKNTCSTYRVDDKKTVATSIDQDASVYYKLKSSSFEVASISIVINQYMRQAKVLFTLQVCKSRKSCFPLFMWRNSTYTLLSHSLACSNSTILRNVVKAEANSLSECKCRILLIDLYTKKIIKVTFGQASKTFTVN